MSFVAFKNYGLEVSRGNIPGQSSVIVFGRNPDIDTGTLPEDIIGSGGVYVPPTTARVHAIVSTSANDTSGGTGLRTLSVVGLNSSYAVISETVTMNGTTPVNTANSYIFIYTITGLTAGSGGTNAGDISATAATDATVSALMLTGYGRNSLGVYQVPAGYTAYITSFTSAVQQSSAGNYIDIVLKVQPFGGMFYVVDILANNVGGSSSVERVYEQPFKVLEKSFIKLTCTQASANNNDVHATIEMILIAD